MPSLLLLNWRDPWHPQAGGAEIVTLRILERLRARGWTIEWFSARYPGAGRSDVKDGIRYVRSGSQATVHWHAFLRYLKNSRFDVVVDQVNTIPFMTPLYCRHHVAFFHQLAMEVWQLEKGPIVGSVGKLLEPLYLIPYRNSPIITVSQSSKRSLLEIGLRGPVHVIPEAVDELPDPQPPVKDHRQNLLVLGRVTPSKRIEESIRAVAVLREKGWTGRLIIAGSGRGSYCARLHALAADLGVEPHVRLVGRVSDEQRRTLLRESALLLMTSVREGWGLVVTEAARHWTPAVVYDVPGLRDSVISGQTGYVTKPDHTALAEHILRLLYGDYGAFSRKAWEFACSLSWDATAAAFEDAIKQSIPAIS